MQKGELIEFRVMKGYKTIVEAKPLWPVDETFYSIPTDGANYKDLDRRNLLASTMQREPVKMVIRRRCACHTLR